MRVSTTIIQSENFKHFLEYNQQIGIQNLLNLTKQNKTGHRLIFPGVSKNRAKINCLDTN